MHCAWNVIGATWYLLEVHDKSNVKSLVAGATQGTNSIMIIRSRHESYSCLIVGSYESNQPPYSFTSSRRRFRL